MHYTAMAGVTLLPFASTSAGAPALSTDLLAIIVAVVAFCLSGIFLLILVPDRARAAAGPIEAVNVPIEPAAFPVHRHPEVAAERPSKGDGRSASAASFEARLRRAPQDDGNG